MVSDNTKPFVRMGRKVYWVLPRQTGRRNTANMIIGDQVYFMERKEQIMSRIIKMRWLNITTIVLLACVSYVSLSYAVPDLPLLQQSDLVYKGAFRVPKGKYGTSTDTSLSYANGSIGYNSRNNSLFIVGKENKIMEISIPNPEINTDIAKLNTATVIQPSIDITGGTNANVSADFSFVGNGAGPKGLMVYGNKLIGTEHATYDADNVQVYTHYTANLDWSVATGYSGPYRLNIGTVANLKNTAGFVSGWLCEIPNEWKATLGGNALVGDGAISIISRSSFGPAAIVFNPENLGTIDPVPGTPLLMYPYNHTTLGTYASDSPSLYYNRNTTIHGIAFPSGTSSVLFFGRHGLGLSGAGDSCYGEGTANLALDNTFLTETVTSSLTTLTIDTSNKTLQIPAGINTTVGASVMLKPKTNLGYHMKGNVTAYSGTTLSIAMDIASGAFLGSGQYSDWEVHIATSSGIASIRYCYDPVSNDKGDHSYPYVYRIWAYDAKDLAAVKAKSKNPWDVVPYAIWNLNSWTIDPYKSWTRNTGGSNLLFAKDYAEIQGVAYDPGTNRIYITQYFGENPFEPFPLIHVYEVGINRSVPMAPKAPKDLKVTPVN